MIRKDLGFTSYDHVFVLFWLIVTRFEDSRELISEISTCSGSKVVMEVEQKEYGRRMSFE